MMNSRRRGPSVRLFESHSVLVCLGRVAERKASSITRDLLRRRG